VRDPHGLGNEEAVQFLGFAHQRAAVGGEGEDAVEAILDFAFPQCRQDLLACFPRGQEVLQREVQA
jgi:hypothetical protein